MWVIFGVFGIIGLVVGVTAIEVTHSQISASTTQQIAPISDPCVIRHTFDNVLQTEIYDDEGVITYRESDLDAGVITLQGTATAMQVIEYGKQCSPVDVALSNLKANPAQGQNYSQFVINHVAQSQDCVNDMDTFLSANPWNDLGVNTQNQTMTRFAECIRHSAFVETKLLPNLRDLLIAEGILPE